MYHEPYNRKADTNALCSYDLDMDTKLAEETTVLMESYTVCIFPILRVLHIYELGAATGRSCHQSRL